MKKIEYLAPEMEIIEMAVEGHLLAVSDGSTPQFGGDGVPGVNDPD